MSEGRKHPIDREKYRRTARNFSDKEKSPEEKVDPYEFSRSRASKEEYPQDEYDNEAHLSDSDDAVKTEDKKNKPTKSGGGLKSFLLPLLAGIIGALLVLGIYLLVTDDEEVQTNENEESTEVDSNQDVSEIKGQLEEDNEGKTITDTTAAVQKAKPAVVSVINMQRMESLIPGMSTESDEAEEAGSGSGVIYKLEGDRAYVVTNHHVVDGAEELKINLESGDSVDAELVGSDIWTDLAVLSIPADVVETTIEFGEIGRAHV